MYIKSLATLVLGAVILVTAMPVEAFAANFLRVGVLIPLSGKDAKTGHYFKKGLVIASKEFPEKFSAAKWHFQDSRSDKRAAISGLRHLIDKQRVHVVIGFASSMPSDAQGFVRSRGVPIILVTNLLERAQVGDLVFNLGTPVENIEKLISSWLFTRRCKQAKGLLVSHPVVDVFAQNLSKRKSFSIAAKFRPSEFDFRRGLVKASHKKTDCVVAAIPVASVERFLGQFGSQPAGKYVLLLQVGGDRIQRKPMAEVRRQELVTIAQRI